MSCSLTIDDLRGVSDGDGNLTGIRVSGTSEECRRIELRVRCRDPAVGGEIENSYFVDTAADGTWDATVDPPSCARCGQLLAVEVHCLIEGDIRHPECPPVSVVEPLACGDCPRIQVERTVSETCVEGHRTVTYTVVVHAAPGVSVETRIDFGDGTASSATRERLYTRSHAYRPTTGTVHPRIEISRPDGCPSLELPGFSLEPCPPPPVPTGPPCPSVSGITAGLLRATRRGCELIWTANVTPALAPGTFTWRFDGGAETTTTETPFVTHTFSTPGHHWVEVRYDPHGECPEHRTTSAVELEGCEPTGGPERDGCIAARLLALMLMTVGLALFLVALCVTDPNLANAVRIAAGVTFLAGLIIFLLWLAFCAEKPCKPGLLLLGLALLGAGYALIHLVGCCPLFTWLGPALAAAGAGTLLGWRAACDNTWCAFFKEIAIFNAGTLVILVFTIAIVVLASPGLNFLACLLNLSDEALAATILAVMDLAFAGVTIRAITCDGRIGDINPVEEPRIREVGMGPSEG